MHVPSRTTVAVFRVGTRDRRTILTFTLPAEADDHALEAFLGIRDPIFSGPIRWEETGFACEECFRPCMPSPALIDYVRESASDLLPHFEHPADAQLMVAVVGLPSLGMGTIAGESLPTVPSPAPVQEDASQLSLPAFAPS